MIVKENERVAIIGKTGSGKSHLMRKFCQQFNRVIFVDPKHENTDLPYTMQTHAPHEIFQEMQKPAFFILYQPIHWDEDEFDRLCAELFKFNNFRFFLDETHLKVVPWHRNLIRMGRSKKIGIWHIIQRPTFIDNYVLSESEHFFIFQLQLKSDKDKIAGVVGEEVIPAIEDLDQYEFVYYSPKEGMKVFGPIR